jgi:hypothetical protein
MVGYPPEKDFLGQFEEGQICIINTEKKDKIVPSTGGL